MCDMRVSACMCLVPACAKNDGSVSSGCISLQIQSTRNAAPARLIGCHQKLIRWHLCAYGFQVKILPLALARTLHCVLGLMSTGGPSTSLSTKVGQIPTPLCACVCVCTSVRVGSEEVREKKRNRMLARDLMGRSSLV
jgi:hypothetical protein